jgi:hypothetical protein
MDPIPGGCLCGAVRFELTAPPVAAIYCHCMRCQRRTGTAVSANLRVPSGAVTVTQGEAHIATWEPPDGAPKCFCDRCGSALWSLHPRTGEVMGVRRPALDRDPGTPFAHRQYTDFAVAWEPIPDDGLPRYGGAPPAR